MTTVPNDDGLTDEQKQARALSPVYEAIREIAQRIRDEDHRDNRDA